MTQDRRSARALAALLPAGAFGLSVSLRLRRCKCHGFCRCRREAEQARRGRRAPAIDPSLGLRRTPAVCQGRRAVRGHRSRQAARLVGKRLAQRRLAAMAAGTMAAGATAGTTGWGNGGWHNGGWGNGHGTTGEHARPRSAEWAWWCSSPRGSATSTAATATCPIATTSMSWRRRR